MPLYVFAAVRESFFDSEAVAAKLAAGKRRAFSRMGAFVRTRARQSIRRRRKSSPPGQPPSAHSGEIKLIFFAWDDASQSVVAGPIPFRGKSGQAGGVVPRVLEFGGDVGGKHYAGNPFMRPALEHERPKFKDMLSNLMG
jgi:hypothetical protein